MSMAQSNHTKNNNSCIWDWSPNLFTWSLDLWSVYGVTIDIDKFETFNVLCLEKRYSMHRKDIGRYGLEILLLHEESQ